MYTESEFMDMSLTSRIDKLNLEILKMVDWKWYDSFDKVNSLSYLNKLLRTNIIKIILLYILHCQFSHINS
jgi:hypothetical protein